MCLFPPIQNSILSLKNQRTNHLFSTMESLLKIVEEPSSTAVDNDADRLKFFTTKVKISDFANLSLNDYQKLSVKDRLSIFKNYYVGICDCYSSVSGIFVFCCFFLRNVLCLIFCSLLRFLLKFSLFLISLTLNLFVCLRTTTYC